MILVVLLVGLFLKQGACAMWLLVSLILLLGSFVGFVACMLRAQDHKPVDFLLALSGAILALGVMALLLEVIVRLDQLKKQRHQTFDAEPFRVGDHPPFKTGSSLRRQS